MVERVMRGCPFCGGEARLYSASLPMTADCADVQVACNKCDTVGPSVLFDQTEHTEGDIPALEAEAITAWNTRIEATPAVDREGVASLFDEALNEHGPAGYGRDTPTQVAFGQVLSKLRHDILALHPVKQSDGLAERVKEACAARVQAMADERFAVEAKFGGFSIAEGNALDRAARTIRSLDITRMDSDEQV